MFFCTELVPGKFSVQFVSNEPSLWCCGSLRLRNISVRTPSTGRAPPSSVPAAGMGLARAALPARDFTLALAAIVRLHDVCRRRRTMAAAPGASKGGPHALPPLLPLLQPRVEWRLPGTLAQYVNAISASRLLEAQRKPCPVARELADGWPRRRTTAASHSQRRMDRMPKNSTNEPQDACLTSVSRCHALLHAVLARMLMTLLWPRVQLGLAT